MRVRGGFTLMELLVVIVIGGILIAVTMPRFSTGLAQTRLQNAVTALSADLRMAHSMAERQRAPVSIAVDAVGKVVRVQDTRVSTTIYSTRYLGGENGFGISSMSSSATSVVIYPNGLASGDLTITLHAGGKKRKVRMTRAGLVRVSA
jgi:prepilin-type N-terminal cleavage/methylation domain-containing protein